MPELTRRDLVATGLLASAIASGTQVHAATPAQPRIPADDRLDIIELMARYAWAYDTASEAAMAATFTPDGVLEVMGKPMADGKTGFATFFATAAALHKDGGGWQHLTDHHVFTDYDGQRCTVHSYYLMPESDASGGNVHLRAMGYYSSKCVRTPAGWRFAWRGVFRWNGKQPF